MDGGNNVRNRYEYNKLLIIGEEKEFAWNKRLLLEQQGKTYLAENIHDAIFHLSVFSYHLILISLKADLETVCRLVETTCKLTKAPILVVLPTNSTARNEVIRIGADAVLMEDCSAEEFGLQVYTLIRSYKKWKPETSEEKSIVIGALVINVLQRRVYWNEKEVAVVKREFDFLYLLAVTPGRVYTYSQIYHIVWQECPQGDWKNVIYCMVYRLKHKLSKIDKRAANIIRSVKDVGYCLKADKE